MTLQNEVTVQSFFSLYGTDTNEFEIHGESARLTINYVTKRFQITPRGQREPMQRIVGALGQETLHLKNALTTRRDPSYETAFAPFVNAIACGRRQVEADLNDGLRVSLGHRCGRTVRRNRSKPPNCHFPGRLISPRGATLRQSRADSAGARVS